MYTASGTRQLYRILIGTCKTVSTLSFSSSSSLCTSSCLSVLRFIARLRFIINLIASVNQLRFIPARAMCMYVTIESETGSLFTPRGSNTSRNRIPIDLSLPPDESYYITSDKSRRTSNARHVLEKRSLIEDGSRMFHLSGRETKVSTGENISRDD